MTFVLFRWEAHLPSMLKLLITALGQGKSANRRFKQVIASSCRCQEKQSGSPWMHSGDPCHCRRKLTMLLDCSASYQHWSLLFHFFSFWPKLLLMNTVLISPMHSINSHLESPSNYYKRALRWHERKHSCQTWIDLGASKQSACRWIPQLPAFPIRCALSQEFMWSTAAAREIAFSARTARTLACDLTCWL